MSKKMVFPMAVILLLIVNGSFNAHAEEGQKYIGIKKCSMCHKSKKKGNQHGKWLSTRHAQAYETLGSPRALEVAKEKGVEGSPQESPKCLKCHVTGYGVDPSLLGTGFKPEEGVQCESCHGPGGGYAKIKIMKDKTQSLEKGLIIPTKEVCVKCHNEESPNFKGFDFNEMFLKVQHPNLNK